MTDHLPLGESTIVLIDARGIVGIWCSGTCMRDMHAMTFLRQVEESLLEDIDSRINPRIDEATEEDG
jgi:hypothetical protein